MLLVGCMVCYEPYLGCSLDKLIYGHIIRVDENSCTISDREGVEHEVTDLSCVFEVDKFPLRVKKFWDCFVYEDGTVIHANTGSKKRVYKAYRSNTLCCAFLNDKQAAQLGIKRTSSIIRVLYYLFVEEFDISNRELAVYCKDGNTENISLDNLALTSKKELMKMNSIKGNAVLREKNKNGIL